MRRVLGLLRTISPAMERPQGSDRRSERRDAFRLAPWTEHRHPATGQGFVFPQPHSFWRFLPSGGGVKPQATLG